MRSAIGFVVFVMCSLLAPRAAWAGELQFDVVENAHGVTLQVRGFEGDAPKKVVTSRTGMLFFFDGSKAKMTRLRPTQKHRIAYAQVGQTGNRVAVRIAQRERARGQLAAFVTAKDVEGGIDIEIVDKPASEEAVPTAEAPTQVADAEDADTQERSSAIAALEASLGGEEKMAKEDAPVEPVVEPETPEASTVAAIAPELDEAPVFEPEPEPDQAQPSSSAALRSLLAVALLFAVGGGAMWWLKRRKTEANAPVLDIVSRVGIGPKQSVVLINAGGRQLLIGATERRIEVLTEIGPATPTAELRVPSVLDRPRDPFSAPRAPIAPSGDPTAPAKIAAFKARLEQALGRELTGEHPLVSENAIDTDATPPHLRLLANDPRWANEEGVA
jgi:flagellar biogenesis protein FliO